MICNKNTVATRNLNAQFFNGGQIFSRHFFVYKGEGTAIHPQDGASNGRNLRPVPVLFRIIVAWFLYLEPEDGAILWQNKK